MVPATRGKLFKRLQLSAVVTLVAFSAPRLRLNSFGLACFSAGVSMKKPLTMISDASEAVEAVARIRDRLAVTQPGLKKVVGLDCEWAQVRSGQKVKGVDVVQIAATTSFEDVEIFDCKNEVPTDLRALLEDDLIIKATVGVLDAKMLMRSGVRLQNQVDLQRITRFLGHFDATVGLQQMCKEICGKELVAGKDHQLSDWRASKLSSSQLLYAAQDAIATLDILLVLRNQYAPSLDFATFAEFFVDNFEINKGGELKRQTFEQAVKHLRSKTSMPPEIQVILNLGKSPKGGSTSAPPALGLKSKGKFYAVSKGHKPGIYSTWPECEAQVTGFPGASHKRFDNEADAEAYIAKHGS
eukprot:TRINITY_DN17475_c0_g1_i1.p1 TRINITY_DN17475_c0_g1~~TRINITY_DN17475_c0_g1_i1.p1  ORF type:complete len:355 (+),score=74.98 TRINITY_DN17475_c0_g1_i1:134-1198(+)